MAVNLENLACWVQQNNEPLLSGIPLGSPSVNILTHRTGIKCKEAIGYLGVDTSWQDCSCNATPQGEINISDRMIEVACVEIFDTICSINFLCSRYEQYIRLTAGKETIMQLEEWIVRSVLIDVANKLEQALYKGDTDLATPNHLNKFDGLIKVIKNAVAPTDGSEPGVPTANRFTQTTGESDLAFIQRMALSTPIQQTEIKYGGVVFLIGRDRAQAIVSQLVNVRLNFIENPNIPGGLQDVYTSAVEFELPGTNFRVIGVPGLTGTNVVIGASRSNLFWGTDYADDRETLDFDYSKFHGVFYYRIRFFSGTQIGEPNLVVIGDFTSDLTTQAQLGVGVNVLSPLGANGGVAVDNTGAVAAFGLAAGNAFAQAMGASEHIDADKLAEALISAGYSVEKKGSQLKAKTKKEITVKEVDSQDIKLPETE